MSIVILPVTAVAKYDEEPILDITYLKFISLWGSTEALFFMIVFLSPLCSKLGPKDQGEGAMEAALHSLSQLDLDYIDLYLIHWPGTQGLVVTDQRNPG